MNKSEEFVIVGGNPLRGEVKASGNKNAALPLLPACLLTEEPVILKNVPNIGDVRVTCEILKYLGADVEWLDDETLRIHAKNIDQHAPPSEMSSKIRSSIVFAGPMLSRVGQLDIAPPGGDVIGRRRLDPHIIALKKLGGHIEFDDDARLFRMQADGLEGGEILMDEPSVTATENAVMASVLAKGTTIIRNAASEPHVQQVCNFLNTLGAQIDGVGTNTLIIDGVERLGGGEFRIGADYLEVGSFISAAVVTGGELLIKQADPQYLDMIRLVFGRLGVRWDVRGNDIFVPADQKLEIARDFGGSIPEIKPQVWPGFPTDMMSVAILVATQSVGEILFHEWMFEGRLFFTDRLASMGARVTLCDPHRIFVQGPAQLRGNLTISSPDIRAGMALVLASLSAEGETRIRNIRQIDRGYSNVEAKLRSIGADIQRVYVDH